MWTFMEDSIEGLGGVSGWERVVCLRQDDVGSHFKSVVLSESRQRHLLYWLHLIVCAGDSCLADLIELPKPHSHVYELFVTY
jgi:hypothetical protein